MSRYFLPYLYNIEINNQKQNAMKTYNEIKSIVDAQDELEMLSKPESITQDEYKYYLNVDKLQREIFSVKLELERKENELDILINEI